MDLAFASIRAVASIPLTILNTHSRVPLDDRLAPQPHLGQRAIDDFAHSVVRFLDHPARASSHADLSPF
jgi:hypothetical protein